jgi:hypothetical protein
MLAKKMQAVRVNCFAKAGDAAWMKTAVKDSMPSV